MACKFWICNLTTANFKLLSDLCYIFTVCDFIKQCVDVLTVLRWFNLWPVRLPLHSFRCHADLSSQVSRLKHQQPACVCPSYHTLCRHPGMTQEVDGLNLWEAALFQGPLWVAEQLEHTSSTHTELHVVERVEADLKGHQQNNITFSKHASLHAERLHWFSMDDTPGWQDYLSY